MVNKKIDKSDFIRLAAALFNQNGYHNSSVEAVATTCGLSKASVYHYVASKKELAELALNYFHNIVQDEVLAPARATTSNAEMRLQTLAERVVDFFSLRPSGCLVSNLAHELLDTEPDFQVYFRSYFDEWTYTITDMVSEHIDVDIAKPLAQDAVAQLQGALLFARLYRDNHVLVRAAKRIGSLLSIYRGMVTA
jgi:TetR/AcrR family transcriptional repressor of nem operon